ncbi:MAG: glycosyltransferase, partial [Pseudomonadota bacterium]
VAPPRAPSAERPGRDAPAAAAPGAGAAAVDRAQAAAHPNQPLPDPLPAGALVLDVTRSLKRLHLTQPTGIDRVETAYLDWAMARPGGAWLLAAIGARQYLVAPDAAPALAAAFRAILAAPAPRSAPPPRRHAPGYPGLDRPRRTAARALIGWLGRRLRRQRRPAGVPAMDLQALAEPWREQRRRWGESMVRRLAVASAGRGKAGLAALFARLPQGAAYLNVGHDNLGSTTMAALGDAGLRRHVMLHDLIPLTHPEYASPTAARRFMGRVQAALTADGILANSAATGRLLAAHGAVAGWSLPPITPLPLGVATDGAGSEPNPTERNPNERNPTERNPNEPNPTEPNPTEPNPTEANPVVTSPAAPAPAAPNGAVQGAGENPYFVMLGTLEGRKNHLLMLALWRGLSEVMPGRPVPVLHIVGRRGWAAAQVFDMLDRAPMMNWTVFEHPSMDDAEVTRLMRGARALLFPSFAEGYGLPLAEALALGVPVIAADLPALREVGGTAPEWLDPLDGPAWLAAIRDYATPASRRRAQQATRIEAWAPPRWDAHFARLEAALAPGARAGKGAPGARAGKGAPGEGAPGEGAGKGAT